MKITKNLNWFPSFANEIIIENGDFMITMKSNTSELEIEFNEGYGCHSGQGFMLVDMELLMELRAELNRSVIPKAAVPDNDEE